MSLEKLSGWQEKDMHSVGSFLISELLKTEGQQGLDLEAFARLNSTPVDRRYFTEVLKLATLNLNETIVHMRTETYGNMLQETLKVDKNRAYLVSSVAEDFPKSD